MKKYLLSFAALFIINHQALAQEIAITCNESTPNEFYFSAGYPDFQDWELGLSKSVYNSSNARFTGGRGARNFAVTFQGNRYEFNIVGQDPTVMCEGANVTVTSAGHRLQHYYCSCDVD